MVYDDILCYNIHIINIYLYTGFFIFNMVFEINIRIFISRYNFSHLSFAYFKGCNMNKRAIDISDIEKKYNSIQKNINYDDVRRRIKKVLDIITDKENNKFRVSQEDIGKYLFPHLGANSSTQSTMSRFVNGNKKAKGDSCPDINALGILSQITGISLDWFLYGTSNKQATSDFGIIKAHDFYRMLFIDLPTKYGMEIEITEPIANGTDEVSICFSERPQISINLPIDSEQKWDGDISTYWVIPNGSFSHTLYDVARTVTLMQEARTTTRRNKNAQKAFNAGISAVIDDTKNETLTLDNGILCTYGFIPF